ncbi:TPA: hypothetical protein ACK3Q6_003778 [Burkholderia cepacia]|uniref:Uncharacterized protein n=2 Tax=Burkholderia cepacia complex TaxID=87882 RepID=A0A250LLJ7_9BURK|nr:MULTISPECIES: hypothetical protein [Burkholderia]HDV6371587.1 hypothetical protein [Burkholderia cepacia]MBA9833740.1 hypothetical protein [Burkholderia contaminans]MBA9866835.1 hypothetical protein [Burkholderia contaminans]MBA9933230.1 hypothetical protein [Burkholderia contaminans]MBR8292483.1 hypothetical protein [Burkholderia cenocepacia]
MNRTAQSEFGVISVSLDVGPSYQAYSRGERWNGWECPYFTIEEAMKLLDHPYLHGLRYDAESDKFIMADGDGEDLYQRVFAAEVVRVDGNPIKVYAIGACGWCWNKAD